MFRPTSRNACRVFCAVVMVFCGTAAAEAQSIVDARRIEFTPSSDNTAVDSNGVALVTNYSMDIFTAGGTTPVQTVNLGKPAPDTDGMIRVDFVALLASPLSVSVVYEAE